MKTELSALVAQRPCSSARISFLTIHNTFCTTAELEFVSVTGGLEAAVSMHLCDLRRRRLPTRTQQLQPRHRLCSTPSESDLTQQNHRFMATYSSQHHLKPRLHQIRVAGYKWIQLVSALHVSGVNAAL